MKNIIVIQKSERNGNVTIDGHNPMFVSLNKLEEEDTSKSLVWQRVLNQYVPQTKIFEHIIIKNVWSIPAVAIAHLTNQYLHGAKITIEVPEHKQCKMVPKPGHAKLFPKYTKANAFTKVYQIDTPNQFYTYKWQPLDLANARIPRKLADYKFTYKFQEPNGKETSITTTILAELNKLKSTKYIPNHLWKAFDEYSQSRIRECQEYNKGDYALAEAWYKEIVDDAIRNKFTVFSPNPKTYLEVSAQIDFEKSFEVLENGEQPLTPQELDFLYHYAHCYGVDIPKFQFRINTTKTNYGYTEEIERVYEDGYSETELNRMRYDPRNPNSLPSFARRNLQIKSYENDKLLRDSYTRLKWLVDNLGDEAFDIRYHRCPVCKDIYHEEQGCFCGHCPPLKEIPADKLFYGHSSEFEDMIATKDAYDELINAVHENDIINELGQDD